MIKDLDKYREQFVRWTLRKASIRWPPRGEALRTARTERKPNPATGNLCWHAICALCKKEYLEKEMKLDHIITVVPLSSDLPEVLRQFPTLGDCWKLGNIVRRMFPPANGFQVLCKSCHDNKTRGENEERKANRKRNKA